MVDYETDRELEVCVATHRSLGSRGLGHDLGIRLCTEARRLQSPILYLMQLEDELFKSEGYLELFDAIGSRDKRLHANPGLHAVVPNEEMRFVFEFMLKHLKK